jgi:hypothetical protein
MQSAKSGLWAPEAIESESSAADAERPAVSAAPRRESAAATTAADDADDVRVVGVFQQGGSSGSCSSASGCSATLVLAESVVAVSPSAAQKPAPFKLQGFSSVSFLVECDSHADMSLEALEAKVENAMAVSKWLGEYGGEHRLSGKPHIRQKEAQRPSSPEPEIFDARTPRQKTDHILPVEEQKRCLDALLVKKQDQVLTTRGHVAFSMFKGSEQSVATPNLVNLDIRETVQSPSQSETAVAPCYPCVGSSPSSLCCFLESLTSSCSWALAKGAS